MSTIFDSSTTNTPSSSDPPNPNDFADVTVETLVGEGRKYRTADDLAKSYANADAFIAKLKNDLAEAKAEAKVLRDMNSSQKEKISTPSAVDNDDAIENLRRSTPPVNDQSNQNSGKNEEKDLSTLFREEYEKLTKEKSYSENINQVSEKLASIFGGEAQARAAIQKKAQELRVGVDWLMDAAGNSPEAFYSIVGIEKTSHSTPFSTGDVNTQARNNTASAKNFRYYEEIRKADRKLYYSRDVQKEMLEEAAKQGSSFYN